MKYNQFQIEQAVKLIKKGFDGSYANIAAIREAKELLALVIMDFRTFADLKPDSQPALYLYKQADTWEAIVNQ